MAEAFQSQEQRDLFDIIDKLRSQGISQYVALPEIIVCGDQSSGKSSVLEAISGMSFPTKDNLCTRFATELSLRCTPEQTPCTVSIIPDPDRPEQEKAELRKFDKTVEPDNLDLGQVVESAKHAMGVSEMKRFSNDILRVELGGPDLPHLTMVDLPGLFSAGDKDQSNEDARIVERMVRKHMKRDRSIILAVISAKNDFANQKVTTLTRAIDPEGSRTMGVITKPDTLHKGSESEDFFIDLAKNRNVKFGLGWHILRNRDYPERLSTAAQRDATEKSFFEEEPYWSLERGQLGVSALKPRLSGILLDHILSKLPGLQADVIAGIDDCETHLNILGKSRSTLQDQKRYLSGVSDSFTRLMDHAVQGTYGDGFFGDAMSETGEARRLRAIVHNRFLEFADVMRENGRSRKIIDTDEELVSWGSSISRKDYLGEVKERMSKSRGRELPGTFNPLIIGDLFSEQCKEWKRLAMQCLSDILDATDELIGDILDRVAAPESRGLIAGKINNGMESIKTDLKFKMDEVLRNHTKGHPITYNHYLTDEVQKVQNARRKKDIEAIVTCVAATPECDYINNGFKHVQVDELLSQLVGHIEVDMENFASSLAADYSEAYFKVASKRFIDDLADLTVERCLMSKAPGLFSRSVIDELDDDEISDLARESPDAAESRSRYEAKLDVLQAGLEDLKKLNRHRPGRFRKDVSSIGTAQDDAPTPASDTEPEAEIFPPEAPEEMIEDNESP